MLTELGMTHMQLFLLYIMYLKFDVIHVTSPHHRLSFRSPHPHPHFCHNCVNKEYYVLMLLLYCNPALNKFYLILSYRSFKRHSFLVSYVQCRSEQVAYLLVPPNSHNNPSLLLRGSYT